MKVIVNTNHLIERSDRIKTRTGIPYRLTPKLVNEWREAIEKNAPQDWRFTESPAADFAILYITDEVQIKVVGRSYRWTPQSYSFFGNVDAVAKGTRARVKPIASLVDMYLRELADPNADIHHELKSVLESTMLVSADDSVRSSRDVEFPHLMLIEQSEADYNLQRRPNALLIRGVDEKLQLWVRQGRPYLGIKIGLCEADSYCLFGQLSPAGVMSGGALWSFTSNGIAEKVGEAQCGLPFTLRVSAPPEGYRSRNYWELPCYLDARYYDQQFAMRKAREKNQEAPRYTACFTRLVEEIHGRARILNRARQRSARALLRTHPR